MSDKKMDPTLHNKVQTAVNNTLMTMVRSICSVGLSPKSAISLVREQLDMIEQMAKEETREETADVPVPDAGDERVPAEATVVATTSPADPKHVARFRGKRSGQPSHPGETEGFWTDEDTSRYGVEPRTRPGVDSNHPF